MGRPASSASVFVYPPWMGRCDVAKSIVKITMGLLGVW